MPASHATVRLRSIQVPADATIRAKLWNVAVPYDTETPEEIARCEAYTDPRMRFGGWIAEERATGRPVASLRYNNMTWSFHRDRFFGHLCVHPEFQGRGIARHLLEQLDDAMRDLDASLMRFATRADETRAVRMAATAGYEEVLRFWESRLDLEQVDLDQWAHVDDALEAAGVDVRTLAELADDADRDRKMYDSRFEIEKDMPALDPPAAIAWSEFERHTLNNPNLIPDAFFIAVARETGAYVGYNDLWRVPGTDRLANGLTGVVPGWRRRGIALALKLRGIRWAKANGWTEIETGNATSNRPMLAINEALGFRKLPAWIAFDKRYREPDSAWSPAQNAIAVQERGDASRLAAPSRSTTAVR